MTHEDLYGFINDKYHSVLNKFFSEHVCIKKGENRHHDAYVLHELVENQSLAFQVSEIGNGNNSWFDTNDTFKNKRFRIKPQDPVYEWQWLHMSKASNVCRGFSYDYYTEDEVSEDVYRWVKIEETKRERKQ